MAANDAILSEIHRLQRERAAVHLARIGAIEADPAATAFDAEWRALTAKIEGLFAGLHLLSDLKPKQPDEPVAEHSALHLLTGTTGGGS